VSNPPAHFPTEGGAARRGVLVVETVLGNLHDPEWATRVGSATPDWLDLDQWNAQKSRLRARTRAGVEVALALDRGTHLSDGDILAWQPTLQRLIAARIELSEVLVVRLDYLSPQTCVELGHAIGNQHWPAVVKDNCVFMPLAVDKQVMLAVMQTHGLPGVEYAFRPGAEVIPYLAPHEARRLFGSPPTPHHHHAK
jgi:urease accessory protein